MAVILFEGPDESGKTTFARALYQLLNHNPDFEVLYERSPLKEHEWSTPYSHYLADQLTYTPGLLIQDRTPEVSESVYGILRGSPRGRGYVYEVYNWVNQELFVVFCKGGRKPSRRHEDAVGNPLNDQDHELITALYDHAAFNLRQVMLHARHPTFRVVEYNRDSKTSWLNTMWAIREWLWGLYPESEDIIRKSLSFSVDSAFPMPKED